MGSKFAHSDGDLMHLLVLVLVKEAKQRAHGEAPVDWYPTPGQAHAEAQRQDLNDCMGKASSDMTLTFLDK